MAYRKERKYDLYGKDAFEITEHQYLDGSTTYRRRGKMAAYTTRDASGNYTHTDVETGRVKVYVRTRNGSYFNYDDWVRGWKGIFGLLPSQKANRKRRAQRAASTQQAPQQVAATPQQPSNTGKIVLLIISVIMLIIQFGQLPSTGVYVVGVINLLLAGFAALRYKMYRTAIGVGVCALGIGVMEVFATVFLSGHFG